MRTLVPNTRQKPILRFVSTNDGDAKQHHWAWAAGQQPSADDEQTDYGEPSYGYEESLLESASAPQQFEQ